MSKYDWSNVPKEIKWLAADADSVINGFYTKPIVDDWCEMWLAFDFEYVNIGGGGVDRFADWQNSLEERPR